MVHEVHYRTPIRPIKVSNSRIKIYSGLSLVERDVKMLMPGAELAKPIKRGDVLKDIQQGYHLLAIVDGEFHQSPSVTSGEIMDALRCGMKIYGCSSMGALRASELDSYGMIGHGLIFEYIKAQKDFRDDLLGQTFHQSDDNIRLASVPYIDLHFNLLSLLQRGDIGKTACDAIMKMYRDLHYSDRNFGTLSSLIKMRLGNENRTLRIVEKAMFRMGSQKKRDAVSMLKRIKIDLARISRVNAQLNGTRR